MEENKDNKPYNWLDDSEFDVIICGTGFTQSLIAGACSRIGKRVLHLDENEYYGSEWASYNFTQFLSFLKEQEIKNEDEKEEDMINEENQRIYEKIPKCKEKFIKNIVISEKIKTETNETELFGTELFDKESRKFNIDLCPRYVLSNGTLVNILVRSGVSQYLEFKALENTYMYIEIEKGDNPIKEVPCSKSDVFKSKVLSLKDKRFLMKFLTFCIDYFKGEAQIPQEFNEESSFVSFLDSQELQGTLQSFILYSIAQIQTPQIKDNKNDVITLKQGLEKMKIFLSSLGRFNSNTPFLISSYGSSELVQAFCRLCAVYGGVYILNRSPKQLIFSNTENNGKKFEGVVCSEGQTLNGKYLIGNDCSLSSYISSSENYVSRAICITTKPLVTEKKTLLLTIPPGKLGNKYSVNIQQFDSSSSVVPKDHYIFYLSTISTNSAKEDLEKVVSEVFHVPTFESLSHETKPTLSWFVYFNGTKRNYPNLPENVFVCKDPSSDIQFEDSINEAKNIFDKIFPDEQFFPDKDFVKNQPEEENPPTNNTETNNTSETLQENNVEQNSTQKENNEQVISENNENDK